MKKKQIIIGSLAIQLIIGGLVWVAHRFGIGKEETKTGPVPQVQVAKVERKSIIEKVIVYGSVVAQPGKTHSVSIAFETRVRHVLVAPGQFVKENDPLIEIELSPAAQVQFQQAKNAAEGAPITVVPVNDPTAAKVQGTVRLVTRRIDPTTRLVDVYVALPEATKLLLDGYVRGEIQRTEKDALVVPRSAVLPNESREFGVFTVANNRAVKHTVKIGAENSNELQVLADDLHPGDPVVTVGNYELEDGMAVEIKK